MTALRVVSFGYGHGTDLEAVLGSRPTIEVDVRTWFRDPHIDPALRTMTGRDQAVVDKVMDTEGVSTCIAGLYMTARSMLDLRLDQTVTVAVGCVGGRHRSYVIADQLASLAATEWSVDLVHLHVDLPVIERPIKEQL
jgi:UPF0042 nucleotide-binding protein